MGHCWHGVSPLYLLVIINIVIIIIISGIIIITSSAAITKPWRGRMLLGATPRPPASAAATSDLWSQHPATSNYNLLRAVTGGCCIYIFCVSAGNVVKYPAVEYPHLTTPHPGPRTETGGQKGSLCLVSTGQVGQSQWQCGYSVTHACLE